MLNADAVARRVAGPIAALLAASLLVLGISLSGPSLARAQEEDEEEEVVGRLNRGSAPGLGTETEVGTGEVVYAEWDRFEVEHARLRSPVRVSNTGMTLPKGLLLEASFTARGKKDYCKGVDSALYCLQDTDADMIFDRVKIVGGARPLPRISGAYEVEYVGSEESVNWRKEVVYQGASSGVLSFTFRTFGSDWTQPRETSEVSYDLAEPGPTEVVYQGFKLIVLSATSNAVRFKVEAGFRRP